MASLEIKDLLINSGTKYRKEVIMMAVMALAASTNHMTIRRGVRGKEIVTQLGSGAQLRPYKTDKGATFTGELTPRELETFLGDVVEEFDPYTLYQTVFGQELSVKRTDLDIVKKLVVEMSRICGENLLLSMWTGVRNAAGTTSKDLFNGFDTIIKTETTAGNISAAKGNLVALGEINSANVGDQLIELYRSSNDVIKNSKSKLYLPYAVYEMYQDWLAATYSMQVDINAQQMFLHNTARMVELVPQVGMTGVNNLVLSKKTNLLVGCDQMSDLERFEINRADNPKVVQFFMTMFFGVQFESIDKRVLNVGSFTTV